MITPKCLQAACIGLPIVKPQFVDALVEAQDAMEQDFSLLPDPFSFEADPELTVNLNRKNLFLGMTFAFWDPAQYQQISPIITAAGGTSVLQYKNNIQLKVVDIVSFIQQSARNATEYKVSVDKAIKSGALIPVKMVITTPEVKQTELLVRINKATKSLGIYLMDQIMFTKSIKAVDNRNMFKLRPAGPMPNLMRDDDVDTAAQAVNALSSIHQDNYKPSSSFQTSQVHIMERKRPNLAIKNLPGAGTSANITDFFGAVSPSVTPSQNKIISLQASSQSLPAKQESSAAASTDTKIKKENTQDIFTFFTQSSTPVKSNSLSTVSSQTSDTTKKSKEAVNKDSSTINEDSATEEVPQQVSATELSQVKRQALISVRALEEATQTAIEYKKRKLDSKNKVESVQKEKKITINEDTEDVEMIESSDEEVSAKPFRPKVAFKDAVRKIKEEQNDMYSYSNIEEHDENEDIAQLRNLAIVESVPITRVNQPVLMEKEGQWAGRQNFKRFIKRRPHMTAEQELSISARKSNRGLVVTLVQADPHEFREQSHNDWLANAQARRARDETPAASIDIDNSDGGESLFVGALDNDDEDDDDEDDDNDEIGKTSFRRLKSITSSVSQSPKVVRSSSSAEPLLVSRPSRVAIRATNLRVTKTPVPIEIDSDNDEDGDEDDGFKFKFSKR